MKGVAALDVKADTCSRQPKLTSGARFSSLTMVRGLRNRWILEKSASMGGWLLDAAFVIDAN